MILPQFWRDHLDIRGGTTASSNPRGGRSLATLGCSEETPHAEVAPAAGFLFAACLLNQRMAARLWPLLEWVGRHISTRICGVRPRIECLRLASETKYKYGGFREQLIQWRRMVAASLGGRSPTRRPVGSISEQCPALPPASPLAGCGPGRWRRNNKAQPFSGLRRRSQMVGENKGLRGNQFGRCQNEDAWAHS
jgi:hypothetical protein